MPPVPSAPPRTKPPARSRGRFAFGGWRQDDAAEVLRAHARTPGAPAWPEAALRDPAAARAAIEAAFDPGPWLSAHATGYYEPELEGSDVPADGYRAPVHALPDTPVTATRREIDEGDLLRGNELCWLRDEVDRFFLQVQGSGRVRLPSGRVLRLGHAGRNGRPYRSIGRALVERGALAPGAVTAQAVKDWLRAHPAEGREVMWLNQSYVFFRPRAQDPADGPLGTSGAPLTALRSLAVDPAHVPLGSLLWLDLPVGPLPLRRLMVAQDTGSAILGPGRVDVFFGTGTEAGRRAGALDHPAHLRLLLPEGRA